MAQSRPGAQSLGCPTCPDLTGCHREEPAPAWAQPVCFSALSKVPWEALRRKKGEAGRCMLLGVGLELNQIVEKGCVLLGNARYTLFLRFHFPKQQGGGQTDKPWCAER